MSEENQFTLPEVSMLKTIKSKPNEEENCLIKVDSQVKRVGPIKKYQISPSKFLIK